MFTEHPVLFWGFYIRAGILAQIEAAVVICDDDDKVLSRSPFCNPQLNSRATNAFRNFVNDFLDYDFPLERFPRKLSSTTRVTLHSFAHFSWPSQ